MKSKNPNPKSQRGLRPQPGQLRGRRSCYGVGPQHDLGPSAVAEGTGKPYDIRERALEFALRILEVTSRLPQDAEARIVRHQLARSGASIGANIEEADGALTRPDTRKSFVAALKEVRETRYWLRIVQRRWGEDERVGDAINEASEILGILSTIVRKLS